MAGTRLSIETVAECGDFDKGRIGAVGIKLLDRRREENIGAFRSGQCAVGLKSAGIARVILVGTELRGVDEETDDYMR